MGGDVSDPKFDVSRDCFTARHPGFLLWLRCDCRYLGWLNVFPHPAQRTADMVAICHRLNVSV